MKPDDRPEDTAPRDQETQIPSASTSELYPTATRGIGADRSSSTQSGISTGSLDTRKSRILEAAMAYIGGIIGMGAIGLFFGLFPGQLAVAADGSLQILTSFLYVPLFLIVFVPIAIGTRNYLYILYPFAATTMAADWATSDLVLWAANTVASDMTGQYAFMLASTIAYMWLYVIWRPLWVLWQMYRTKPRSFSKITVGTYGTLYVLFSFGAVFLSQLGTVLYSHQQRERAAVRLPITEQFAGLPKFEKHSGELKSYWIHYSAEGGQAGDTEQVFFVPLKEWWNDDIRTACGNGIVGTTPRATYEFKKTPSGIAYAEAVVVPEVVQYLSEAAKYKEYHHCFVVGYQRYDYIKTLKTNEVPYYDAATVIDAIVQGEQILPACITRDYGPTPKIIGAYCTTDDMAHVRAVDKKARQSIGAQQE